MSTQDAQMKDAGPLSSLASANAATGTTIASSASAGEPGIPRHGNPKTKALDASSRLGPGAKAKRQYSHLMPRALASPTDKIMSPASRGVEIMRHRQITSLPPPQSLLKQLGALKKGANAE